MYSKFVYRISDKHVVITEFNFYDKETNQFFGIDLTDLSTYQRKKIKEDIIARLVKISEKETE